MDYIIGGIHINIPREFTAGAFGMALAPFTAKQSENTDLTLNTGQQIALANEYRKIDDFDFADADADCHFGRDAEGYLLTMTPRDGSPKALFRKPFNTPTATSNITTQHHPALFRFGLWSMFNIVAVTHRAVAIHSSVIDLNGEAVLFLGESGTGKSTHTRLWREHIPGATLLNDDSPILRITPDDGGVTAFGSPWSGKTPCYRNTSSPIRAIVRLSQATHNRIHRLRPIQAIGALLPSCPPSFAHDERLQDAVCTTVADAVAHVPVYHLECLPDAAAAELACHTIFGSKFLNQGQ